MTNYLFSNAKKMQWSLLVGDITLILISIMVTYTITSLYHGYASVLNGSVWIVILTWCVVIFWYVLLIYMSDQYNLDHLMVVSRNVGMLALKPVLWGVATSTLLIIWAGNAVNRDAIVVCFILTSILFLLWRWVAVKAIRKSVTKKRLAIVGYGRNIASFSEELSRLSHAGIELKKVCVVDMPEVSTLPFSRSVVVQKELSDLLAGGDFDMLALDATNGHFSNDQLRNILQFKYEGKAVHDLASLYENLTGKVPIMAIDSQWLIQKSQFQRAGGMVYRSVKRTLDVIMASCLLVLCAPLLVLIAVAVKLESKGPALFVQERLGVHRRPFRCYKFRTMVENAEGESGPVWATGNDPRITRVGSLLRKSRLDELPQLWNILKGEMTFVGPRPIREYFANRLSQSIPFFGLRFSIKPGLTGWAQVNYDYAGSDEGQMEKFQYDLFYILNMSLRLDLLAIFKTFKTVIKRAGT